MFSSVAHRHTIQRMNQSHLLTGVRCGFFQIALTCYLPQVSSNEHQMLTTRFWPTILKGYQQFCPTHFWSFVWKIMSNESFFFSAFLDCFSALKGNKQVYNKTCVIAIIFWEIYILSGKKNSRVPIISAMTVHEANCWQGPYWNCRLERQALCLLTNSYRV